MFELAALKRGERVLDIGCGDGNYTGPAADRTGAAIGLDQSSAMLEAARQRVGGRADIGWVRGDAERLPFPDMSFDVVLGVTVLCFAHNRQAVVNEAARVLRSSGRWVLGELGCYSSWAAFRIMRGLLGSATWRRTHFFSPKELRGLVARAGLVESELRGAVFYPPVQSPTLLNGLRPIERVARRRMNVGAAFLALRAVRPS